ncbi:MAG: hypothetical protein U1F06_05850 [Steroidobacteraceae bacterium]
MLDLPVDAGLARARRRADGGDRFEDETRRFFERVRARYLELTHAEPRRCRRVDATAAPEQVLAACLAALADLLPPRAGAA